MATTKGIEGFYRTYKLLSLVREGLQEDNIIIYAACQEKFILVGWWDYSSIEKLKEAMMTIPILTMPDFFLDFVIETKALGIRLGAILMQEGKSIAYISKSFLAST